MSRSGRRPCSRARRSWWPRRCRRSCRLLLLTEDQLAQLLRDLRERLGSELELPASLPRDDVLLPPLRIGLREVFAGMTAAALLAHERGAGAGRGDGEQRMQIEREVPARVELAVPLHRHALQ